MLSRVPNCQQFNQDPVSTVQKTGVAEPSFVLTMHVYHGDGLFQSSLSGLVCLDHKYPEKTVENTVAPDDCP